MSQSNDETKPFLRAVLVLLACFIAGPIMWGLLARVSSHNSQVMADDTRASDALRETQARERARTSFRQAQSALRPRPADAVAGPGPQQGAFYQPVQETEYRQKTVKVATPEFDPKTGKTTIREHQQVYRYPVTTMRLQKSFISHDPKVQQLANELRQMDVDDEKRDGKMQQLRQRLELEFAQMHENQANQIEATEKRLESLKKLHQERGANREKIVRRRMDELMGKTDALRWNPGIASAPVTPQQSQPQYGYGVTQQQSQPQYGYALPTTGKPTGLPGPPHTPYGSPAGPRPMLVPPRSSWQPATIAQSPSSFRENKLTPPPAPRAGGPPQAYQSTERPAPSTRISRVEVTRTDQKSSPTRVDVSTTVISKLFQLARNSANARSELAAAEAETERLRKLSRKGLVSTTEIGQAELRLEKLTLEVNLNRIEFEALADAFKRDLELSKAALTTAENRKEYVESRVDTGSTKVESLLEAKLELLKAEKAFESAQANLEQLELAAKLVGKEKEQRSEAGIDGEDAEQPVTGGDHEPKPKNPRR